MAALSAPILGGQRKATLDAALFGEPFHETLVHETALADLAARRRGTASTLGRGEVAMTTAKAFRQKGTGRARAGALSVPHRRGGGVAFGPKPRSHGVKVNRKARRRALRAALSVHAERDTLAVLADGTITEPATKTAAELVGKWAARTPILVILAGDEEAAAKSFRNIPRVSVARADGVGVVDVIAAASLVVSEPALPVLAARTDSVSRVGRPATDPAAGSNDGPEAS
jgi:large subunit ribosomal protein L4